MSSQELPKQQLHHEDYPVVPSSDTLEIPSSDTLLPSSPAPMKSSSSEISKTTEQTAEEPCLIEKIPHSEPEKPPNPRLDALLARQKSLASKLADLESQRAALIAKAKLPSGLDMPGEWSEEQRSKHALASANSTIKEHISLLHSYNEIKDIAQGLIGMVAEKRGVRVGAVMEDFGMSAKD